MQVLILVVTMVQLMFSTTARYVHTGPESPQTIPCPSCAGDRCAGVQVCHYGVFHNEMCGDRLDCYKAPGELCGETVRRVIGRCRPGLQCRCGVCVGHLLDKSYYLHVPCREQFRGH